MFDLFFSWRGRINRLKYFYASLAVTCVVIPLHFLSKMFGPEIQSLTSHMIQVILFYTGTCLSIKRFHDIDKSAFGILFLYVPYLNIITFIILVFCKGTDGPNQYGSDPLIIDKGYIKETI